MRASTPLIYLSGVLAMLAVATESGHAELAPAGTAAVATPLLRGAEELNVAAMLKNSDNDIADIFEMDDGDNRVLKGGKGKKNKKGGKKGKEGKGKKTKKTKGKGKEGKKGGKVDKKKGKKGDANDGLLGVSTKDIVTYSLYGAAGVCLCGLLRKNGLGKSN